MDHNWPGNVRELENAIERAMVTCRGRRVDRSRFRLPGPRRRGASAWEVPGNLPLTELERRAIIATLERTHGNIKEAAASLGIDRSTLYDKIKRYEIPR